MDPQNQNKILKEYQTQAEAIISKMLQVLIRAQRKKDDQAYRQILDRLEKNQN